MEQQQPQREITAVDHINKHLLDVFKQKLDSGKFELINQIEEANDEWEDDGGYNPEEQPTLGVIGEAEEQKPPVENPNENKQEVPPQ